MKGDDCTVAEATPLCLTPRSFKQNIIQQNKTRATVHERWAGVRPRIRVGRDGKTNTHRMYVRFLLLTRLFPFRNQISNVFIIRLVYSSCTFRLCVVVKKLRFDNGPKVFLVIISTGRGGVWSIRQYLMNLCQYFIPTTIQKRLIDYAGEKLVGYLV